jgi:tRNA nucleotidyltransferase (CCA-adding enzyme)
MVRTLGKVSDVGKAFAVLKLVVDSMVVDVGIPRTDSKMGSGHTGFAVHADPSMSYTEAARRRDFTINAIMLDPLTGEIIDPFHGVDDLNVRRLKIVDAKLFGDDPLRVLRGLQFAARFGLSPDEETRNIMRSMAPSLKELPKERIGEEWRKLLLRADRPSIGLELGMDLGVYEQLHPELPPLAKTEQEPEWHPEGNVWVHTMMCVDVAARVIRRERLYEDDAWTVVLGALCHDFGKPSTTCFEEGRIRSRGHEEAGREPTGSFLRSIAVDQDTQKKVINLVVHHLTPSMFYHLEEKGQPISDGALRALARRLHPATIEELALVSECDYCGMGPFPDPNDSEKKTFRTHDPYGTWLLGRARVINAADRKPADVVRGQELVELGFEPGPELGELIKLANKLRDDHGATREDVLTILTTAAGDPEIARSMLV